jgi:DNA-binding transcriptional regulator YiaG
MIDATYIPGGRSALLAAASSRKHRPQSHPLLGGKRRQSAWWNVTPLGIRERRIAAGLSQYGLAALLGVSRTSVAQWEQAKCQPSPEHVDAIREMLR